MTRLKNLEERFLALLVAVAVLLVVVGAVVVAVVLVDQMTIELIETAVEKIDIEVALKQGSEEGKDQLAAMLGLGHKYNNLCSII
jgi:uncharacterized cupredoxin-like copper-binding protein